MCEAPASQHGKLMDLIENKRGQLLAPSNDTRSASCPEQQRNEKSKGGSG